MKIINNKEIIWYEKYRPQCVDDLLLPQEYKIKFKEYIKNPTNILLCSETPGTGKTSTMNAIIKEGNFESLFINASLERGIDTIRSKINIFASTVSFDGGTKLVVLDEFDNFSVDAMAALRGTIEEYALNARFILTCNYKNKIIEPILNRTEVYDFDDIMHKNTSEMVKLIYERLLFILNNENIKYDNNQVLQLIKGYFPSIRGMYGHLQKSVSQNILNIKDFNPHTNFDFILDNIKSKNVDILLQSIYNLNNPDSFYIWLYKNMEKVKNKAQVLLILAKYQFQSSSVRDKNLNLAACCIELGQYI